MPDLYLSVFESANGCDEHPIGVAAADVVKVVLSRQWCSCEESGGASCGSYCDTSGAAVYQMRDGSFAVVTESSDTSGHG